ncbi:hypothetical protein I553_10640 [Mycobacterium xenopi 4042]|uniref:Uncharacterized protein n=1 Tax=Mycobacterium xenopi 4042 TaxID=1299334 RepID=X7ZDF0_MYCXE|nr:hypothetical protein I553_10640 [Mycobacterium xenopi 4042]
MPNPAPPAAPPSPAPAVAAGRIRCRAACTAPANVLGLGKHASLVRAVNMGSHTVGESLRSTPGSVLRWHWLPR